MTKLDMNKDPHKEFNEYYEAHKNEEFLDADGYPTDVALKLIEMWRWDQPYEWFDFIKNIWDSYDSGWRTYSMPHGTSIAISTRGWSGNESIIEAMQRNFMLWGLTWVISSRGGHYDFEIIDEEE